MLDGRIDRNKLRKIIMDAEDNKVITKEEAGFIVSLAKKFRNDIEEKIKQLHVLQGEISQLKLNEKTIIDLIQNMVAAAERDLVRQETMKKLKAANGVQDRTEKALKDEILDDADSHDDGNDVSNY